MKKKIIPFANAMELRYRSHPWHGIEVGTEVPNKLTCFIEIVPTDSVKYEIDKTSGYLKIDRPLKYSTSIPALYGFVPQTFCGDSVAEFANKTPDYKDIKGDGDPLDICVLTEKPITHGDIIVEAIPIGGISLIDGNDADDKIIAVMKGDAVYGGFKDIKDVPENVIKRLEHYFLSYKDMPGQSRECEIRTTYGAKTAKDVIKASIKDYKNLISEMIFS
jgi:inorganic pyrophosphatase